MTFKEIKKMNTSHYVKLLRVISNFEQKKIKTPSIFLRRKKLLISRCRETQFGVFINTTIICLDNIQIKLLK